MKVVIMIFQNWNLTWQFVARWWHGVLCKCAPALVAGQPELLKAREGRVTCVATFAFRWDFVGSGVPLSVIMSWRISVTIFTHNGGFIRRSCSTQGIGSRGLCINFTTQTSFGMLTYQNICSTPNFTPNKHLSCLVDLTNLTFNQMEVKRKKFCGWNRFAPINKHVVRLPPREAVTWRETRSVRKSRATYGFIVSEKSSNC